MKEYRYSTLLIGIAVDTCISKVVVQTVSAIDEKIYMMEWDLFKSHQSLFFRKLIM